MFEMLMMMSGCIYACIYFCVHE